MSKTIEQKVVEMRFDNRQFESNVKTTMSTLDKLKEKLKFSSSTKGLENVSAAASKVNMNGLSGALTTVQNKFSALEVMGITALANITNSAVNAGKRMVHALTVAPISDGWQEYELTMNTIQTIMNSTGKSADEVQEKLKVLDKYADKTVYSTADMFNNIYKFTNAGIDLDTATQAMIGIANATADAGQGASQASIAYYNLAQSLSTGFLTTMDYKSLNIANIMTNDLKQALADTAVEAGTLTKAGDGLYKSGKKTYNLQQLYTEALSDQWATADVLMKVFGEYADETTEVGQRAWKAATEVKTFTGMMESLKATAGTGWKDTWQIVFGGLDEAKKFWTGLSVFLGNIITGMAKARNTILESALGKSFTGLFDKIKTSTDGIKKAVESVQNYSKVVDEIINGKWGNGQTRWDKLTAAGYDWAHAQNLVNEKLGYSLRRTTQMSEAQNEVSKSQKKTKEITADYMVELAKLSDAELEAALGGKEQVKAFREIQKVCKQTGIPLKEFIENIDEIDGRWILINSFKNLGLSLVSVFKSIGEAWKNAFPPMTGDQLFNIIAAFHKFSTVIKTKVEKNADELTRTLKGLFAIIDLIAMVAGGAFRIAFTILKTILGAFNLDLLDFTALIGDAIVKFRDWIENNNILVKGIQKIISYIFLAVDAIRKWITNNETIAKGVSDFKSKLDEIRTSLRNWVQGLKETDNIPKYIISGLVNGLKAGAGTVFDTIIAIGKGLIEAICKVLRIQSPSREFFEIGKYIIQGLFNGISGFVKMVYDLVMTIGEKLISLLKSLDIGSIFMIAIGTGAIYGFVKIAKALDALTSPLKNVAELVDEAKDTLQAFQGLMGALKFKIIASAMQSMATAIAILAGSVIALTLVDPIRLAIAVGAIIVLMGALAGLTAIAGKFGGDKGLEFGKISLTLIGLGIAMALMAKAVKTISNIEEIEKAILGLIGMVASLSILMKVVSTSKKGFIDLGKAFMSIGAALLMMALVTKILGGMDQGELIQGTLAIAAFSLIITFLMASTKLLTGSKNVDKIGKTISKVAGALLLMVFVAKIAGNMDRGELIQGGIAILAFGTMIAGLMWATKLITGSKNVDKIGGAIAGIAGAMLMMVFVAKIAGNMSIPELIQGTVAIGVFSLIITGLIKATKHVSGKDLTKIGTTILMLSVSIGLLALVAAMLSLISIEGLIKGVTAVGFLSIFMIGLIQATEKVPQKILGTLIVLTSAITILSIALGILSTIQPERLLSASVALGIVIGMFALVVKATNNVKSAIGTLIVVTAAVGVLAGVLYLLAKLPAESVLSSSIALSVLLVAMAGVMALLGALGGVTGQALLGILGMVALCVPLYLMVDVLSKMQGIKNASKNAEVLGKFMGVLAIVQLLCAATGAIYMATGGMAMLGLVGMIALVGTLYLLMGALAIMSKVNNAMQNLEALTSFIETMTVVLVALAIVGPLALIGVSALTSLTILMAAIGVFATAVGFIMEKFPDLQKFLNTGIDVLVELASGIGEMIGAFVSGALTKLSSGLPEIGKNLSLFMINATPFIAGATTINRKMVDGVKAIAEAILIITGANILESLTSWLTGGNSLSKFGSQLGDLGTHLKQFVTNIGTFTDAQVTTVSCAGKAITALANAAKNIPGEGGIWQKIVGEKSIADFGDKLPGVGTNLRNFVANLGTFTDAQVTTVDCAGKAIKALAESASEIPNDGGLAALFAGENSIDTFAGKLPGVGTNLASFVTNLGTFTDAQVTTVDCAGKAIKALATAAGDIPNEGGLAALFAGDNDISKFASKLPGLGTNLANFVKNLGVFSTEQINTVTSACNAIKVITGLGNIHLKDTANGLTPLGTKLVTFAGYIKAFADGMTTIGKESLDASITKVNDILTMIKSAISINVKSLTTFGDSLKKLATDAIGGFVNEFSGIEPKEAAEEAISELLDALIDGADRKKPEVVDQFKMIAEETVDALSSKSLMAAVEQVGKDFTSGFARGIKANKYLATSAASDIGKAALRAAKEAIDSNSPSKETMKIGGFFGEGFALGIKDYADKTYDAGYSIAEYAKNGLSKAMSKVSDMLSTDMDTQPTIRPVLDLSDVKNGASSLNTMFNNGPSVGVTANLSSISSGMNAKLQNGTNGDVVTAINKLRKDLGNVGGTTNNYNVNGVTYDDGSNITNAVEALVRAAVRERRV